jgi:Caenorhabditis protein of unknown function, DUF268
MRGCLVVLRSWMSVFGFDPVRCLYGMRGLPRVLADYSRFKRSLGTRRGEWPISLRIPCPADRLLPSGTARGHYFHQDLLVARRIFERAPRVHIDVGSRIDGFVAHVASYREIVVLDIRPLKDRIPNVKFIQQDIMAGCDSMEGAADSVSCLHALEHFGLGRYGDELDPDGHERGFRGLANLVSPGGFLYLSVPIGRQRIDFNGHRVLGYASIRALFRKQFELVAFSLVDDDGNLHEALELDDRWFQMIDSQEYGCGIFELRKK